ncbi:polyprenol monophosphomannose synthase [Candidatus Sumerlaeota bacterium]|nr:polyprenol monophosphomannose synthase [Candidatus Sumerlaeota bacterium]
MTQAPMSCDGDTRSSSKRPFVVIATYNEKENIQVLIPEILRVAPEMQVLVVDDSSPDGTSESVRQMAVENPRVHLLLRGRRMGYGSACIAGFKEALRLGAATIFTMDADLSHDPRDLLRLAEGLENSDVVIGSRYVGGIRILNWPLRRLVLSLWANWYVRTILRLPYTDCTSGFRAYRQEVLQEIDWQSVHSSGYAFLVEILFDIAGHGYSVSEAPVVYTERRAGQSKMSKAVVLEAVMRPWILKARRAVRRCRHKTRGRG